MQQAVMLRAVRELDVLDVVDRRLERIVRLRLIGVEGREPPGRCADGHALRDDAVVVGDLQQHELRDRVGVVEPPPGRRHGAVVMAPLPLVLQLG